MSLRRIYLMRNGEMWRWAYPQAPARATKIMAQTTTKEALDAAYRLLSMPVELEQIDATANK